MMELSARMRSVMPYRKAADVLAEFLPIPFTESFIGIRASIPARASIRARPGERRSICDHCRATTTGRRR